MRKTTTNLLLHFLLPAALFFSNALAVHAQSVVRGTINDCETKEKVIGATILLSDNITGTATDADGNFSIKLPAFPATLKISAIGYGEMTVSLADAKEVSLCLQTGSVGLEEIVISSGYTVQVKSEFSGAVSSIAAKQLINRPAVSFDQLLGGQATGIDIIQPTNILNNTPVMRIRGLNTITSGLFPLVVVDGVSVFVGNIGGLVGNNPLSNINPNDIEYIDVLKDASATAIYGSRAANGVMVITTKKGKPGKAKVSYGGWISRSTPFNLPKLLNAEDYMMIKNEALTNAGKPEGYFPFYRAGGELVNTNWYDVAYRPGFSHNHNISISGANDNTSYYFSSGYTDQNSFIKNNTFKRLVYRLNLEHSINEAITIGTNIMQSNAFNQGTNTGAIASNSMASSSYNSEYITNEPLGRMTYVLPPNVPVYNEDGSYSIQNGISVGYGNNVPATIGTINAYNLAMVQELDINTSENNTHIGNAYGEWNILKNLKFRTSYGMNYLALENKSFFNPIHGGGAASNGIARNTNTKFQRSDWVNTLLYQFNIKDIHQFSVLLGHESIKTVTDGWGAAQTNSTDPYYTNYQGGYINISPFGNVYGENALLSYFTNLTYNFNKKYLFTFNFRRDGLSALAPENRYGNFGGGSIGWNIYEEEFFKNTALFTIMDNVRVRASYGIVGNSEIGDYPTATTYVSDTYGGTPTLVFAQAGNPDLQWETSKKLDIGINFTLFKERVSVEFDYYNNQVDDLILKAPQSLSAGIPGNYINANVGSLYNRGIELGINAVLTNYKDFKWNAGINISTLKNKVTSLVDDVFVPSVFGVQNMTRVGYSIGSIYAVPCKGVNPDNGLMVFTNSEGRDVQYNHIGSPKWTYVEDGGEAPAIDNYRDGVIQGPSLPTLFGGINNSFKYKNFDLHINITFVHGNKLYNGTRATLSDQRYFNNGEFIKDRWTTPGQETDIQKLYYGDNVSAGFSFSSTSKVESGAYMKLKNISMGYHVPLESSFLRDRISKLYVYLQGGNLYTLTKYRGSDPEVSINGNSIHSGKDQNVPPNAQVFTLGLNLDF